MAVPASWAYVLYHPLPGDPQLFWHQRRLLGVVDIWHDESYMEATVVASPDSAVFVERYDGRDPDVLGVVFSEFWWPPPVGVPVDRVHRFAREPLGQRLGDLYCRAAGEAMLVYRARAEAAGFPVGALGERSVLRPMPPGIVPGTGLGPLGPPLGPPRAGATAHWHAALSEGPWRYGDRVEHSPAEGHQGHRDVHVEGEYCIFVELVDEDLLWAFMARGR